MTACRAEVLSPAEVPLLHNLESAITEINQGCRPLLLEFSAEYCEYCSLLEENILKPIRRNRDYDKRVVMRKVMLGDNTLVNDFDGKSSSADKLARRYNIMVTPTLIFVDTQGKELAERMVGVTTLDFYGGYLDDALDLAKQKLEKQGRCQ
jgi:thioredoxin-related protein